MTDASTTGAVDRLAPYAVDGGCDAYGQMESDPFGDYVSYEAYQALVAERDAAIKRAEAAEAECARLKNIRSAIAEGYNAEAVSLEKSVSETLTAQLTAARRAEAAAWNDAIEAAVRVTLDRQGRRAMGDGHGNSSYDIGVSDAANAIRALRRAAPTEGEVQSLDDTTRAVLDRAERIVAGQSQQERRIAEIFLRPTESRHD